MEYYFQLFLQTLVVSALVGTVYFVVRKRLDFRRRLLKSFFVAYITGVLWLVGVADIAQMLWHRLFGKYDGYDISFFSGDIRIFPEFTGITGEMLANFVMLLPFGVLFPLAYRSGIAKTLVASSVLVLAIEVIQPVFGRTFDTNDIILNFSGAAVSTLLFFGMRKLIAVIRK